MGGYTLHLLLVFGPREYPGGFYRLSLVLKIAKAIMQQFFTGKRGMVKRIQGNAPGTGGKQQERLMKIEEIRYQGGRAVMQSYTGHAIISRKSRGKYPARRQQGGQLLYYSLFSHPLVIVVPAKIPEIGMATYAGYIRTNIIRDKITQVLRQMERVFYPLKKIGLLVPDPV